MSARRRRSSRFAFRFGGPASAVLLAFATTRCGLLGAPGGYSGAEDMLDGAPSPALPIDGEAAADVVVLPDGNVVPASMGTLALVAGERDPSSPEDNPAWSADAWSGILDATGHVASWRIEKSAPIVGTFDSAGLVGNTWVMINVGFGLAGGRGTAIQSTTWKPGIAGDWRAGRANGAPGGLDEPTRAFFGSHLAYIGGTRTVPVDGGTSTFFTNEVHIAEVDVAKNELGPSGDSIVELAGARSRAAVVFGAANVYVVGGRVQAGVTASVEMAKVDVAAGTVEAFAQQPPLKEGAAEHKVWMPNLALSDGHLWVAGGRTGPGAGTPTDVVLSAKIDPATGALGEFQSLTRLPRPLRDFAFVSFKGRLYAAGGVSAAGRSDEVFSATIDAASGTIGAWETNHARLPGARSDFVALAY